MKCTKCDFDFDEKEIQEHHVHPRFMDNENGNGMKVNLCKRCHDILHLKIPAIYWGLLTQQQREKAIEIVIDQSKKYGGLK